MFSDTETTLPSTLTALVDQVLSNGVPVRSFNTKPSTSVNIVRQVSTVVDKFKCLAEKGFASQPCTVLDQMNYTRSASLRHLHMWKSVKWLFACTRKVLPRELKDFLRNIHTRMTDASMFLPTEETLLYITARIIEQIYRLEKVQKQCISATDDCLDFLDLTHWQSQAMVSIAIAADITAEIPSIVQQLISIYGDIRKAISSFDNRFPTQPEVSQIFQSLQKKQSSGVHESDSLTRLLKISHGEVNEARMNEELKQTKTENAFRGRVDTGVAVSREEFMKSLNTTDPSCLDTSKIGNDFSLPSLNVSKKSSKKMKGKTGTVSNNSNHTTPSNNNEKKTKKKQQEKERQSAILEDVSESFSLKTKKLKEKNVKRKIEPVDFSQVTPVTKKKKKLHLTDTVLNGESTPSIGGSKIAPLFQSTPMPNSATIFKKNSKSNDGSTLKPKKKKKKLNTL